MSKSATIWRDSYLSWPPDPFMPHSEVIQDIFDGISGLIRNGSTNIYISFGAADTAKNHNYFKTLCSNEGIEFEELKTLCCLKELNYIQDFLRPIVYASERPFIELANELQNFLESMLIANRAKAHIVDQKKFGPLGALRNIEFLRQSISDKSIWKILDRLEGMIREYSGNSIFRLHGNHNIEQSDFEKIKSSSDYIKLAGYYDGLGYTKDASKALASFNKHVKRIATADATGAALKLTTIGISVVASTIAPLASLVEFIYDHVKARDNVEFIPVFIPSKVIGWQQYNSDGLDE